MRYYYSYRLFVTCSRASRPPISGPALMGGPLITFSSPHIEWNWEARRLNLAALNLIIQRALFSATFKSAQFLLPPPFLLLAWETRLRLDVGMGDGDLSFYSFLLRHSFWVLLTWYIHLSRFLSFFFLLPSPAATIFIGCTTTHSSIIIIFFLFSLADLIVARVHHSLCLPVAMETHAGSARLVVIFFFFLFDVCV